MSRIGIAGAGLAGRLFAWHLARLGHEVDVVDPSSGPWPPAARPAGAGGVVTGAPIACGFSAAGLLGPLAALEDAGADVAALGWRSLELWPAIVAAFAPGNRSPSLFRRNGSVLVAHPEDAGAAARLLARIEADGRSLAAASRPGALSPDTPAPRTTVRMPQAVAPEALPSLEPALARGLHGWYLPGEGQLDAQRLMVALCVDAVGVRWHWGGTVAAVEPRRLRFEDGQSLHVDWAIDTRGLGARQALGLRGVRGELLWLHAPQVALKRPVRVVHPRHRVCIVPRRDDVVIVGSTEIESEDRSPATLGSTVDLLGAAQRVVPRLADSHIVRLETNLRPTLADQRPVLHCEEGLIRLNGLYRHGWMVGPALVQDALSQTGLGGAATGVGAVDLPVDIDPAPLVAPVAREVSNA